MLSRERALCAGVLLLAVGCSNGATSSTPQAAAATIASAAKLQFAVGTATIGSAAGTIHGINFVSTFRGSNGLSATLANTPTLTGPPTFAVGFPGSLNSLTGLAPNVLAQYLQSAAAGTAFPPSYGAGFGPLVGVFGYGMAADNLLSAQVATQLQNIVSQTNAVCPPILTSGPNVEPPNGITGAGGVIIPLTSEAQSQELGLPVGSGTFIQPSSTCPTSAVSNPNALFSDLPINYYGGPPAWPSPQGYGGPAFFLGYPLGFTDFAAPPVAGTYSLDVAYPTSQDYSTSGHFHASASLLTLTALPPIAIARATAISGGTGTVSLNVPPGLFETIVFIRTLDCSIAGSTTFDNYAVVTHASGPQSIVFGANLGPPASSGQPSATFCSNAFGGVSEINATAYAAGFDYPAYESSYPFDLTQTPKITNGDGHTGQADVTTSAPFSVTTGS